ncbi:MAG: PAS domain-containing hybrid sensor histidine kinase/response regulator [Solirubrobacteraceae bacterium]
MIDQPSGGSDPGMPVGGPESQGRPFRLARLAWCAPGVLVVLAAGVVLVGWLVNIGALKSLSPGFSQMKVNTAVAFGCAGVSLLLLQARRGRRLAQALAIVVVLIGATTLCEYVLGWHLGIDQLLVRDASRGPGTPSPGRMGVNTAFGFVAAGLSLLLIDARWRRVRPAQAGAAVVAVVGLVSLLGHVFGAPTLTTSFLGRSVTPMALHTATAFLVLAAGLVMVRPHAGIVALLRSRGAGGVLMRRLLVPAVLVPVLAGYARLEAQRAGLFGTDEGVVLFASSLIIIFGAFVVVTARSMERVDAERRVSEASERGIVETALDCIITIDEHGRILDFNPAAERTFGYRRGEAVGRELASLIVPPALREAHRRGLARSLATGQSTFLGTRRELTAIRSDGSEFPLEIAISRLRRPGPPVFVGYLRDITDRKRDEDARRHLAAIVGSSDDAIIGKTLDGTIESWNSGAERLYGYTADEMIGQSISLLVPEGHADELPAILERIARGQPVASYDTQRVTKTGRRVDVSLTVSPITDDSRRVVGASAIVRDLTERRQLEDQLRQAQKMEAVGQLAGGVAHDFNNLLTVITGYVNLLLAQTDGDPQRAQLVEVKNAAERASELTAQLLTFSRRSPEKSERIDLNELVRGVEKLLRRLIDEDIALRIAAAPALPPIQGDRGQFEQVLINLVVNARDAMPGGGEILIETSTTKLSTEDAAESGTAMGRHLVLAVSDTGSGMTVETKARIFEPFFTTKGQGKGTGLGLATVYGIIQQAGGTILVDSEPGRGSRFSVLLPAAAGPSAGDEPAEESGGPAGLVVEDEPALRRLVRSVLDAEGYHTFEAANGRQALEFLERHQGTIDLVLTDVVMPEVGGPELGHRLATLRPETQVIYMSGYADSRLLNRGLRDQPTNVLRKPFSPDELAARVAGLRRPPQHPAG